MEYYIYVTNKCNMNCTYCSVMMSPNKTSIPNEISYSLSDLKNFIDQTQKRRASYDKDAVIYFFGGEPTLNFNKILEIINLFNKTSEYKVTFILHTNGLLLNVIPKAIISKINVIFLSLNYEKIFFNGQITPYFQNIIRVITQLKNEYSITTIGRFTISNKTSLYTETTMSGLFFDYIYWQIDNQKIIENISEYKKHYIDDIDMLFNYWLSFLEQGVVLTYIPFLAVLRHLINKEPCPTHSYCGYGDDMVYIQTDGSCHGCCDDIENGPHYVGDIFKGIKFIDMEIRNNHCNKCEYLKICGGRCGRMHKDFTESRIKDFCEMNIYMFNLVKDNFERISKLISLNPKICEAINDKNIEFTEQVP